MVRIVRLSVHAASPKFGLTRLTVFLICEYTNFMDIHALKEKSGQASRLLKSLANDRRLLILCHLSENEKSVGELERLVDLSQSALSQHLARLRRDNLVHTRREAQTIFYSIASAEANAVLKTLYELYCSDDAPAARTTADAGRRSASGA
ncbi:MAG: DNA-binding transcriptional ArsR family regulator [Alphaproteobacteria bacterium]|jgi:DNA-binding transcriptional ArsR family regulator